MASPMARLQQKTQAAVATGLAGSTGIPCTMVLRLIRGLPGVPGFLATVASREASAKLDTSVGVSGPHDFAVRVRIRIRIRIRIARLAIQPRPSHPDSNVRGDARAPLLWNQNALR